MTAPERPLLRWHGGKWLLAPKIIPYFPPHQVYVEPFGGAASVLLRKPRSYAEIYNDLDREAVNLFRVLRNPARAAELTEALRLTPFAREEFNGAYKRGRSAVERARRLIVRSFMGYGSDGATGEYRTGFRANSNRSGSTPAADWRNFPDAVPVIADRLRGVVIERRDAAKVMLAHDAETTLHYLDPPYPMSTRSRTNRRPGGGGTYRHELDDGQHVALLDAAKALKGMVILSSYACDLYDQALAGWQRVEIDARADGAAPRTEILYINRAAAGRLEAGPLFAGLAA